MIPRSLPLFVTLCALVATPLLSPSRALADLTVTARENADGSATFSLRGSATYTLSSGAGILLATNFSPNPASPPMNFPVGIIALPEGLFLNVTGDEQGDVPMGTFAGSSSWFIYSGATGLPNSGTYTLTGNGSVRIPDFPFYALTPGTFRIEAAPPLPPDSLPEEGASEDAPVGFLPYTTVYEVIPFDRDPSISGQSPGTIKVASGSKGTGSIRITNTGNVPLVNLALSEGTRDFKLGKPASTSLAPGESTTCPITFSAKKKSSRVKVGITASTPDRRYDAPALGSAEESEVAEIPEPVPFVIPGEVVKTAVKVRGEVAAGARAPRNPVSLLKGKSKDR